MPAVRIEQFEKRFDFAEARPPPHGVAVRVCVDEALVFEFREMNVVHRQFEGSLSSVVLHLVDLDRSVTIRIRVEKCKEQPSPVYVAQRIEMRIERSRRNLLAHITQYGVTVPETHTF